MPTGRPQTLRGKSDPVPFSWDFKLLTTGPPCPTTRASAGVGAPHLVDLPEGAPAQQAQVSEALGEEGLLLAGVVQRGGGQVLTERARQGTPGGRSRGVHPAHGPTAALRRGPGGQGAGVPHRVGLGGGGVGGGGGEEGEALLLQGEGLLRAGKVDWEG